MITTCSIDVAAYLHLNGIDPVEVRFRADAENVREFVYDEQIMVERYGGPVGVADLIQAFMDNAQVPARQFSEARAHMKALTRGTGKPVVGQRTAFGQLLEQALQQKGKVVAFNHHHRKRK